MSNHTRAPGDKPNFNASGEIEFFSRNQALDWMGRNDWRELPNREFASSDSSEATMVMRGSLFVLTRKN